MNQQHRGQHQERAEDIGVLKGPARPAVEREDLAAGKQPEIGGNAYGGAEKRACNIGPLDEEQTAGIGADNGGVEYRRCGEKAGDGHIHGGGGHIAGKGHRHGAAGHEEDEKHGQRAELRPQAQPEQKPQHQKPGHEQLVRGGFLDHEAAKEHGHPQGRRADA
ncbi:hypothetical protein APZ00_21950 [Pannonibacter phragmitetus]|uniref:Uncharacterized protein n=1 Tax=Pannonibacter phragmitetus TaxID=121719 RepID=A0A0U3NI87_9HYPH|nr:hypothetical protein APZ00_21950 [Pannonibacter phragmitetus]